MLQPYIDQLLNILRAREPSRTLKERSQLEELAAEKVLQETENFIKVSLPKNKRNNFINSLNKAFEKDDIEQQFIVLIRFLTEIPDVKYRLYARMQALMSDIQSKLLMKSPSK